MQQSDKSHRIVSRAQVIRWVVLIVIAAGAGFWLLLWLVSRYLDSIEQLAASDPALAAQRVSVLIQLVLASSFAFALLVGSYLSWYGYRAVKTACFPPPGSWLIEGRPVYHDNQARQLGWLQIVLGVALAGVASGLAYRTWSLLP